jgi:endothelin-converting enzyme
MRRCTVSLNKMNLMLPLTRALAAYYENLTIDNVRYFENKARAATFQVEKQWSNLRAPSPREDFTMTPQTVTASYFPSMNEIILPAAVLRTPILFDPEVPSYLSYGALGAVYGHELSHAFDPFGSLYDADGRYSEWWPSKTRSAFNSKASCFIKQYSDFTIDHGKHRINGSLTLTEKVADAGGVHAAWKAWEKHESECPVLYLQDLEGFPKLKYSSYRKEISGA